MVAALLDRPLKQAIWTFPSLHDCISRLGASAPSKGPVLVRPQAFLTADLGVKSGLIPFASPSFWNCEKRAGQQLPLPRQSRSPSRYGYSVSLRLTFVISPLFLEAKPGALRYRPMVQLQPRPVGDFRRNFFAIMESSPVERICNQ